MGWKGALVASSHPHMKVAAPTCDLWLDTLPVPQARVFTSASFMAF